MNELNLSWYARNRSKVLARVKQYRIDNPDKVKAWSRRGWMKRDAESERERLRTHYANMTTAQREHLREYHRNYVKQRKAVDPAYRIAAAMRKRISHALKRTLVKGAKPKSHARDLLGCTFEEYRLYLESKFEPGMSWANYGNRKGMWSIDHIVPCASFDLTDAKQQQQCFHFTNTQPMWAIANLIKGKH